MALTAKYTEQIVARVSPGMRAALKDVADRQHRSVGDVIRQMIDAGLDASGHATSDEYED